MNAIVLIDPFVTLALVGTLVYYRLHKRFKRESPNGLFDFLGRNMVELIIGLLLIPGGLGIISAFLKGG